MANITEGLKNTIKLCPHIKIVYFCKDGSHFINIQIDPKTKKKYSKVTPSIVRDEKTLKGRFVNTFLPENEIVESLTREEILGGEKAKKVVKE